MSASRADGSGAGQPMKVGVTSGCGAGCARWPSTIPAHPPGANQTTSVTATSTAAGSFDNIANVTANEPDPVPANNTDNSGNGGVAAASADVSVDKNLTTGGPFTIGQTVTYTLFIQNIGPSVATNIQVTDTPSNLSITNVSGGGC